MQVEAERLDAEAAARAANLLQRTWLALQQRREGCRHDEEQRAQEEKLIRWRLALAPPAPGPTYACRGTACRPAPAPTTSEPHYVDRSMLFQSSLAFTW
jgi:hypothetical protein